MKLKAVFLCVVLILFVSQVCIAEDIITLKPGQEEFRKLDSIKRISVADPYIADAKVLSGGQQLMIRGLNPGETTVTLFDEQEKKSIFHVKVISMMSEEAEKIAELLKGVDTVNVRVIDNKVVIDGSIIREQDKKSLIKVKELYKDINYLDEDNVSNNPDYLIEAIEYELPSTVSAKLLGDGVMLEGTVASNEEKSQAEQIAKQFVDNVYSVLKIKEVNLVATVSPVEFLMEKGSISSSLKPLKVLEEGLKMEKGIFGFTMEDEIASENLLQGLNNNCSGLSAFEGVKDYNQSGQYVVTLDSGENLYIFFQFDVVENSLFKVSVSLLDSQKKVLSRNEFYASKLETIGISGFYNTLRNRKKMSDNNKELVLVFDLKS